MLKTVKTRISSQVKILTIMNEYTSLKLIQISIEFLNSLDLA